MYVCNALLSLSFGLAQSVYSKLAVAVEEWYRGCVHNNDTYNKNVTVQICSLPSVSRETYIFLLLYIASASRLAPAVDYVYT